MTGAATVSPSSPDELCDELPAEALLSCLDDQYTRQILTALQDGPMPARDLVATCDCSRPTVYRRLDDLTATNVVTTAKRYDPDGHHRTVFSLAFGRITFELQPDGIVARASQGGD